MHTRKTHFTAITLALSMTGALLMSGCDSKKESENVETASLQALTNDVLVRVNGYSYTDSMHAEDLKLYALLLEKRLQSQEKGKSQDERERIYNESTAAFNKRSLIETIKKLVMLTSVTNGGQALQHSSELKKNFAKQLGKSAKFEDLMALVGKKGLTAALLRNLDYEQSAIDYFKAVDVSGVKVDDNRVEELFNRQKRFNEVAAATNELIMAQARRAAAELRGGGKIAELSKAFFPNSSRGEMQSLNDVVDDEELSEDEAELWPTMKDLKVNGTSDPVAYSEGIAVIQRFPDSVDEQTGKATGRNFKIMIFRQMRVLDLLEKEEIRDRLATGEEIAARKRHFLESLKKSDIVLNENSKSVSDEAKKFLQALKAERDAAPGR